MTSREFIQQKAAVMSRALEELSPTYGGQNPIGEDCALPLDGLLTTLHLTLTTMELGTPSPVASTTTTTPPPTVVPTTGAPTTTVTTTSLVTTTTRPATCGNGTLDRGEQCDGENLFGRTCKTLGFVGGTLRCDSACIFDNSGCHF